MPMIYNPRAGKSGRDRQLDYEKAFRYWIEFGTLKKVCLALEREGHILTRDDGTQKPFSINSIQAGAWIWVIHHPDEALAIWQGKGYFLKGKDDDWKKWIAAKIRKYLQSHASIDHALELNGIKEWYGDYYKLRTK